MNNNINGDYLFNDYNTNLYHLDTDKSEAEKTLMSEILFDEADNSENVDGFQKADSTEEEKDAQSVDREDLPEGSTVKDGKIYDKDGKEIGYVEVTQADYDGDGVEDKIESYYLYETDEAAKEETRPEHAIAPDELPEGAVVENGKIYDKDGNEIGRIAQTVADATGDGKTDTITQYYLYDPEEKASDELPEGWKVADDGTITTDDGRKVEAVNVEDLPEGYKVEDGKIFDKDGNEIGRVVTQEKDTDGDGVADTVDSYYLYTEDDKAEARPEHAVAKDELPEGYEIKDGKIFDKDGNEIGRIQESVKDVTGDGKTDSVTQYFLYDEEKAEELPEGWEVAEDGTITTDDGRKVEAVNVEDLPEGYKVEDGKIFDKDGKEIGRVVTQEKDTDGDGVADTVDSYYLYTDEEPSEYAVAKADLPEGYEIKDGKIYDKDGKEIGRIEESVKDATGDGKTDSVTQYYLYGEKPEGERTASAVNKEDLPDGATVKEGVIYDKDGNEIGYTQVSEQDTDGDGVADTVESYYLYD